MKIVDRATFLALPPGTLFAKYEPCIFEDLLIKEDTFGETDFLYQQIVDSIDRDGPADFFGLLDDAQERGTSIPMDFDCLCRDGLFDEDQLFAVFEPQDVRALIERLQRALASAPAGDPAAD